ncbi:hypothetical protein L9F63_009279, partial [Diploptera punctata]
ADEHKKLLKTNFGHTDLIDDETNVYNMLFTISRVILGVKATAYEIRHKIKFHLHELAQKESKTADLAEEANLPLREIEKCCLAVKRYLQRLWEENQNRKFPGPPGTNMNGIIKYTG